MALTVASKRDFPEKPSPTLEIGDLTPELSGHPAFHGHEKVLRGRDRARGLDAIVAIHSTTLGPAIGGTRVWRYDSFDAALTDVLRLSHGMTMKAAVAGLPHGGGKAVILAGGETGEGPAKSAAALAAYAEFLSTVAGDYYTAEDVGLSLEDADFLRRRTRNVLGTTEGGSGNPSPVTAHGVYLGLKAAVRHRLGKTSLQGLHVAVSGLGAVGMALARQLAADGARLSVADIDEVRLEAARDDLSADCVRPERIHAVEADVFAPCALGAVLNDKTIPELRVRVVAGAANNQLATIADAAALAERDILYAPDYVINAGGLMNVAAELKPGGYDRDAVMAEVARIPATLAEIFSRADADGVSTETVAARLAAERLTAGVRSAV